MEMLRVSVLTLLILRLRPGTAAPLSSSHAPAQTQLGPSEADIHFAENYLQHYYGLHATAGRRRRTVEQPEEPEEELYWTRELCEKVERMQRFFGLPPSGELNKETLVVMRRPRCGLSDVEEFENATRWTKKTLSYRISNMKLPISKRKVHKVFRTAWKIWSSVAPMKFRKRSRREADIAISFHSGDHEDGSPFDGKEGILAHAFLPGTGIGGDVHFDAEEDWSFNSTGYSLLAVAVHEFGHALGLAHSSDPGAVMFPAYNFAPNFGPQLSFTDVKDIQHRYGVSPGFASLMLKNPPPRTPDKCDPDLSFDAVTELRQELLFFKDRFMWRKHPRLNETGITLISSLWPNSVPSHLDAVYENVERDVNLFFKGNQYWLLRQLTLEEGFPSNISDFGFPSRIKSVDAALHFRVEQYTEFFTGHEYWRYNELKEEMESSPMLIQERWPGIPTPIDAAVFIEGPTMSQRKNSNPTGLVHFFKGNIVYEYDPDLKAVLSTSTANKLLECNNMDDNETLGWTEA